MPGLSRWVSVTLFASKHHNFEWTVCVVQLSSAWSIITSHTVKIQLALLSTFITHTASCESSITAQSQFTAQSRILSSYATVYCINNTKLQTRRTRCYLWQVDEVTSSLLWLISKNEGLTGYVKRFIIQHVVAWSPMLQAKIFTICN